MKVLFYSPLPFSFAHGGLNIQIEQTKKALEECGVEVEYLRWWDDSQTGDIVHFFGRPAPGFVRLAQAKGMKVVVMELLTGQGSRPHWKHKLHRWAIQLLSAVVPPFYRDKIPSEPYKLVDANMVLTSYEADLLHYIFATPCNKIHIIPNGIEPPFFLPLATERSKWLVCTAAITPRKRILELTEGAIEARTPLWIIGEPYSQKDPYYAAFLKLQKAHTDLIRYEGGVNDRTQLAHIYNTARGFVLLSTMESRSLSAEEASAAKAPLLLSDLPWARSVFERNAIYAPITDNPFETAKSLRKFYDEAPNLTSSHTPFTWKQVAGKIIKVYESLD